MLFTDHFSGMNQVDKSTAEKEEPEKKTQQNLLFAAQNEQEVSKKE
jgi:hypothetical protein